MTATGAVAEAARVLGDRGRRDEPIGALTTYRVGGRAALFFVAESEADLRLAAQAAQAGGAPVLVIGRGSNLLVADAGFVGLAVAVGEGLGSIDIITSGNRTGGTTCVAIDPGIGPPHAFWSALLSTIQFIALRIWMSSNGGCVRFIVR